MNYRALRAALTALALAAGTAALAQDSKPAPQAAAPAPQAAPSKAQAPAPKAKAKAGRKRPRKAKGKQLELNGATKAQLKALPGIDDARADRIIAARPFYTKGMLVNVLGKDFYLALRDKVMVAPPPLPGKKK